MTFSRLGRFGGGCALVVAAIALASAAGAVSGVPAADRGDVLAGVRSCAAATAASGVDPARLLADGWSVATVSGGKPTGLDFYGRGPLLAMIDPKAPAPLCIFTAHIPSVRDFPPIQAALAAAYGAPIRDDGKGDQMFLTPDRHIVDLASTGSNERPAVRVAVGLLPQEKQ